MSKPSWKDAPLDATHVGVDYCGEWVWFRNEPSFVAGAWWEHFAGHSASGSRYEEEDGPIDLAMERRP